MGTEPRKGHVPTLADTFVRYDLRDALAEVRVDFSPDSGSQRLLKQSEIAARFRKRLRAHPPAR